MRCRSLLAGLPLLTALACDSDPADTGGTGTGEEGGTDVVPITVDCSFVFDGVQEDLTFEAEAGSTQLTMGTLEIHGMLSDDEFGGRSFSLGVHNADGTVGTNGLYQMVRTALPANQFVGDHGFTGLQWVRDPENQENLQFACWARSPDDPPHAWQD